MCDLFHPTMSGEIFQPLETFEEQVESGRGPLTCRLCTEEYEDPRILNCCHVFCGKCLRGRAVDGFMTCPLCGTRSFLTSGSPLPPLDPLFKFLLKSSEQERAVCANCDCMQDSMFFCNTCSQALCAACKEETHRAKMFASHQVIALKKRTKEKHRKCATHSEDYIMFSTEKQELLCIKCFRDFEKDDRALCLDLESAYNQSCRHLEERIATVRDLQSAVHDAIILFQALMQEVRSNAEKERASIRELCAKMQERITKKRDELLQDVDSQHLQKEQAFKDQLPNLAALLPTLQTYLAISTMFVTKANMYEFLDLSSSLMERLESMASQPHQLRPNESGEISTRYESQFAKCLQPLLRIHLDDDRDCGSSSPIIRVSMPTVVGPQQKADRRRENKAPPLSCAYISSALARHLSLSRGCGIRRGSKMPATVRHCMQEGSGPFVEHCKAFEANFRLLQHRIQRMKEQVQEIHRDITRRKCLAKKEQVTDILDECSQVEIQISTNTATLEHMKIIFVKIWQEMLDRVSSEQDIYQNQLKDMNYLKQENSHLATIARQIAPYISSIEAVAKQIDPRSQPSSPCESDNDSEISSDTAQMMEDSLMHMTQLVLGGSLDKSARKNTTGDAQPSKKSDAERDHGNAICESKVSDGRSGKNLSSRMLPEKEEFERVRAKKIVLDAIISEQSKLVQPEGAVVSEAGTPEDVAQHSSISSTSTGKGVDETFPCGGEEKRVNGEELAHSDAVGRALACGGKVKMRDKGDRPDEGEFAKINGGDNGAGHENQTCVSVISRVSDDQADVTENQTAASPMTPSEKALEPERIVVKRKETERKRSVLSVTVTTSEDDVHNSDEPLRSSTNETDNVVWRVRNCRNLRELANKSTVTIDDT